MFTGIVEELGKISSLSVQGSSGKITVKARKVLEGTRIGDSIAVNGVCLTVVALSPDGFTADIMAETVRRSSFKRSRPGDAVNLERAMAADGRFGGHIVAGHVDGTGTITSFKREENAVWITINAPRAVLKYIIEKGSIAIDGVSLTVAYVDDACFKVSVIPHTAAETTLLGKRAGDDVNLENDMVGKYVEKLLLFDRNEGGANSRSNSNAGGTNSHDSGNANGSASQSGEGGGLTMEMLRKYDF